MHGPWRKGNNNYQIVYWNFSYCPLAWHCYSVKPQRKTEKNKTQEWALRILYDDYKGDYTTLITKSGNYTREVKRLRILALTFCKILNNLNHS